MSIDKALAILNPNNAAFYQSLEGKENDYRNALIEAHEVILQTVHDYRKLQSSFVALKTAFIKQSELCDTLETELAKNVGLDNKTMEDVV